MGANESGAPRLTQQLTLYIEQLDSCLTELGYQHETLLMLGRPGMASDDSTIACFVEGQVLDQESIIARTRAEWKILWEFSAEELLLVFSFTITPTEGEALSRAWVAEPFALDFQVLRHPKLMSALQTWHQSFEANIADKEPQLEIAALARELQEVCTP